MEVIEYILLGSAGVICIGLITLNQLFGPGIDRYNPRTKYPLTPFEKEFLQKHIAHGAEETGIMSRPRPGNQSLNIFYRLWMPKQFERPNSDVPKGVVFVIHGMSSHSARNNTFMVELLAAGYIIAGIDLEGNGRSDGRHGYFSSIQHLVDDAKAFVQILKNKYPEKKLFLHGGSLGGLIVLHMLTQMELGTVDGAIILCPVYKVHPASRPSKIVEKIADVLRAIAPKIPLAAANRGKNSAPELAEAIEKSKAEDPLFYQGLLRIGTGLAFLDGMNEIQNKLHMVKSPYLLQHGTGDVVVDVSGSFELHNQTTSTDKSVKTYERGSHDLSNDLPHIRNAVVNDFVQWISERT